MGHNTAEIEPRQLLYQPRQDYCIRPGSNSTAMLAGIYFDHDIHFSIRFTEDRAQHFHTIDAVSSYADSDSLAETCQHFQLVFSHHGVGDKDVIKAGRCHGLRLTYSSNSNTGRSVRQLHFGDLGGLVRLNMRS